MFSNVGLTKRQNAAWRQTKLTEIGNNGVGIGQTPSLYARQQSALGAGRAARPLRGAGGPVMIPWRDRRNGVDFPMNTGEPLVSIVL